MQAKKPSSYAQLSAVKVAPVGAAAPLAKQVVGDDYDGKTSSINLLSMHMILYTALLCAASLIGIFMLFSVFLGTAASWEPVRAYTLPLLLLTAGLACSAFIQIMWIVKTRNEAVKGLLGEVLSPINNLPVEGPLRDADATQKFAAKEVIVQGWRVVDRIVTVPLFFAASLAYVGISLQDDKKSHGLGSTLGAAVFLGTLCQICYYLAVALPTAGVGGLPRLFRLDGNHECGGSFLPLLVGVAGTIATLIVLGHWLAVGDYTYRPHSVNGTATGEVRFHCSGVQDGECGDATNYLMYVFVAQVAIQSAYLLTPFLDWFASLFGARVDSNFVVLIIILHEIGMYIFDLLGRFGLLYAVAQHFPSMGA